MLSVWQLEKVELENGNGNGYGKWKVSSVVFAAHIYNSCWNAHAYYNIVYLV